MVSPKQILDTCLAEIYNGELTANQATALIYTKWEQQYPLIQVAGTSIQTVEKQVATSTTTTTVTDSIDDLWGDDLGESIADELGVEPSTETVTEEVVTVGEKVTIAAHISDGLSKPQLDRMGFTGGGLVITMVLPQLVKKKVTLKEGDAVFYKGSQYRILEKKEVVQWTHIDGNLYLVLNCGA
jgi:hypothetical protein